MRRSNIKRLESVASRLRIEADRIYKVCETDGDNMHGKDSHYLGDAYKDLVYMAGAMERIAKVAREDADELQIKKRE